MKRLAILIALFILWAAPAGAVIHRVSLTWNAAGCVVPGACTIAGYHVYRAKGSGPLTLANPSLLTTLYWTDKNVYPGQVLHYCITAVSTTGLESACSVHVVAKIP